jgi:putative redox protein
MRKFDGEATMPRDVVVTSGNSRFLQEISVGPHLLKCDELVAVGGDDAGPNPYELLLAGLGACTGITLRMYADRKGWPLKSVRVRLMHEKIYARDCADCETKEGMLDLIRREISLVGELSDDQRQRLLEIANRCPVHRALTSEVRIETRIAPMSVPAFQNRHIGH